MSDEEGKKKKKNQSNVSSKLNITGRTGGHVSSCPKCRTTFLLTKEVAGSFKNTQIKTTPRPTHKVTFPGELQNPSA